MSVPTPAPDASPGPGGPPNPAGAGPLGWSVADGQWQWNLQSNQLWLSHPWAQRLGLPPGQPVDASSWLQLIEPADRPKVQSAWGHCKRAVLQANLSDSNASNPQNNDWRFEVTYRLGFPHDASATSKTCDPGTASADTDVPTQTPGQAEWSWMLSRGRLTQITSPAGQPEFWIIGQDCDITALKMSEERYRHLAVHDSLTGLPNRTLFFDRLEHGLARARRRGNGVAVLFLDLDRFKSINDDYGHAVGDELLCVVADRLRQCVRPGDTVARLAGDEFTVLLEAVPDTSSALAVAHRMVKKLNEPIAIAPGNGPTACLHELDDADATTIWLVPSASVGVAVALNSRSIDADDLLRQADAAMYQSKSSGLSVTLAPFRPHRDAG